MIQLPDISTDAGVLSRLIIAECENPGYSDYDEADGQLSFRLMQAVVANRLANNPSQFGAPGATTQTAIITAPNQFAGFSVAGDGTVQISTDISTRIDAVITNANTGNPGAYYQFVQDILTQVNGPVNDPLSGVVSINGTAVQGGVYGWRTAGSGDPGGLFFPIPSTFGGLVLGNQFYTLLPANASAQKVEETAPMQVSAKFKSGQSFLGFLKSSGLRSGRTAIDGYVTRTETDEFLMFSRNPDSMAWTKLRTQEIQQVEYFGEEIRGSVAYAKIRITL